MNTPKTIKRAKGIDPTHVTRPVVLYHPVSDHVAAYIGLIVTEYIRLEKRMIDVFRAILRIESGEGAVLAYNAIKAPAARWEIVRRVLQRDNSHAATPASYDTMIDEFGKLTDFRNACVHGIWNTDKDGQPWLTKADEPADALTPKKFAVSDFDSVLDRMNALEAQVRAVAEEDLRSLDKRWLERSQQGRGNSS